MLSFLKKFFKKPSLEDLASISGSGVIKDPDFGFISYEPPTKKEMRVSGKCTMIGYIQNQMPK